MRDFLERQRENVLANIVASIIFAGIASAVAWLSALPAVPVPAWLFVAVAAFLAARWWFSRPTEKMKPVVNETFGVEQVRVDGKHFADCKFIGSELVFQGRQNFSLKGCEIAPPLRLRFEGPAGVTLAQLVALNSDPTFVPFVQAAITLRQTDVSRT